jgi:hypothetical protein
MINPVGMRFGRLVVLRETQPIRRAYVGRATHKERRVHCACDCGGETIVCLNHLRQGRVTSCGCARREKTAATKRKHGFRVGAPLPEYNSWRGMRARCENRKHSDFHNYGGRGIAVSARWRESFENFLADMGRKPSPVHSLDRIDVNGDYEPGNCRWATPKEQRANQRTLNRVGRLLQ